MEIAGHLCEVQVDRRSRVRCEPDWHLGREWAKSLKDFDLWYVWAGRGQMRLDSSEISLRPGVCLWMRPGRRYEAEQDSEERLGVNFIHFSLLDPTNGLPLSDFEPPFEVWPTRQADFVDGVMRRVIELGGEPRAEVAERALLGGLLAELEREQGEAAHQAIPGIDLHHRDVVVETAAKIRESPAQAPTVAGLAQRAGYSVDHFSRIFKSIMGLRPQDYVIQAKIERARQLLAESNLTVGEVAERVGYQEIFYFSRQFRQKTGQSPSEYRRSLRSSGG